jgi:hypothetical protein
MRRAKNLITIAIISSLGMGTVQAHAEGRPLSKFIELVFSADDELCAPLARVYNGLLSIHADVPDLERQYAGRFRAIGLVEPRRLSNHPYPDDDPGVTIARGGVRLLNAYYDLDLTGDGRHRQVFADDECSPGCHEFSTVVWISKPSMELTLKEYHWPDGRGGVNQAHFFDPASVALSVSFAHKPLLASSGSPPIYRAVYGPYFFDKIATEEERSLSTHERLEHSIHDGSMRGDISVGGGDLIQQVWVYKQRAIFSARNWLGIDVLIYRYTDSNSIDDVCYLAPAFIFPNPVKAR